MDLNYLLSRHQISLVRAADATCCEARSAHRGLATIYAARISKIQRASGATFELAAQL